MENNEIYDPPEHAIASTDDFEAFFQVSKTLPYPVSFCGQKATYVGGSDMLPSELPFDFTKIESRIDQLLNNLDCGFSDIYLWATIFLGNEHRIPIVIDVGSVGVSFCGITSRFDPFKWFDKCFDYCLTTDIVSPVMVGLSQGRYYIRVGVEELTNVFSHGKRANLIHINNVLTGDGIAAEVSDHEKIRHILIQVRESLMEGGLAIISNVNNVIDPEDFEEVNLRIIFDIYVDWNRRMYVVRKN